MEPLIFEDFDGPYDNNLSPDGAWRIAGPWPGTGGNWLDPNLADVSDGELSLTVAANEVCGSEIQTLDGYSYGYYETNMKVSDTAGVVNSFFAIAEGYDPGTIEIDVEFLTNEDWIDDPDSGRVHFVLHPTGDQHVVDLDFNPTLGFHRYGFLWEPGKVSYTVDGEIVATFEDPLAETDADAYIMMNAWTGNPNWGGGPPKEDATAFYDFVKFYDGATEVITTIRGTGNNDVLTGGSNVDVFEMSAGDDRFLGFAAGTDFVDFSQVDLAAADVSAAVVDGTLVLTFGGNSTTIDGTTWLSAADNSLGVAFNPDGEILPEPEPEPEPEPTPDPVLDGAGFWADDVAPAEAATDADPAAAELGLKFTAEVDGFISAIQFYEPSESRGENPVSLWTDDGQLLARQDFAGVSGAGWREIAFDTPVAVKAGETYVASYHSEGRYAATQNFFWEPVSADGLVAPTAAGVYGYGAASEFPDQSYMASNYWVDVVFTPEAAKEGQSSGDPAIQLPAATMEGTDADDSIRGTNGHDVILGGEGDDTLLGKGGNDVLRGQDGDDLLRGHGGTDTLIGGLGEDDFLFHSVRDSSWDSPDEIRAGDGAIAFEGAGVEGGDVIDIASIDAVRTLRGDQAFTFGSSDKGGLWLMDVDGRTAVRGNTDGDASAEIQIWIDDGAVNAADYAASDFII